ncbi:hypothetical protein L249_4462, partial [Ophiocordyceps polyrhachis-furcata BCC 54312]
ITRHYALTEEKRKELKLSRGASIRRARFSLGGPGLSPILSKGRDIGYDPFRERSTIAIKLKVPRVTYILAKLAYPQGYFFK